MPSGQRERFHNYLRHRHRATDSIFLLVRLSIWFLLAEFRKKSYVRNFVFILLARSGPRGWQQVIKFCERSGSGFETWKHINK